MTEQNFAFHGANGASEIWNYWLAGMSTFIWSQEQAENILARAIEQNRITREDSKRITDEFIQQTKQNQLQLQDIVNANIKSYISAMKIPTQTIIDELKQQIDDLVKKIDSLNN